MKKTKKLAFTQNNTHRTTNNNGLYGVFDLTKDKHIAEIITRDSCWRPDIYLNNDRSCEGCALIENCCCALKKIRKKA